MSAEAFVEVYTRYAASNREARADLWALCWTAYLSSLETSIRELSDIIGKKEDTVGDWARVGWLIGYTEGCFHTAQDFSAWSLPGLWDHSDALSYDHLLRAAKLAKRLELSPAEVLERLWLAMDGNQKAESLERDIEEAHEDELVLFTRDLKRIRKRLKQNAESLSFRGALSASLHRAFVLLDGRIEKELQRLEEA